MEPEKRVSIEALPQGFHRVRGSYGFMERPDVQEILATCGSLGLEKGADDTIYYLGRTVLLPTEPRRGARRAHRVLRSDRPPLSTTKHLTSETRGRPDSERGARGARRPGVAWSARSG